MAFTKGTIEMKIAIGGDSAGVSLVDILVPHLKSLKDVEVMAAAKLVGLVDSKVVGFSETLTALRFTRRR